MYAGSSAAKTTYSPLYMTNCTTVELAPNGRETHRSLMADRSQWVPATLPEGANASSTRPCIT
uniref:Uncharacterized protein n=1 Tax=Anguilla anguilla TaxID=7936 RepID=A0A0E9VMR9_ANGAN